MYHTWVHLDIHSYFSRVAWERDLGSCLDARFVYLKVGEAGVSHTSR